ncbi:MAG: hypothetical protein QM715_08295 [Nibricoccus sp.]
MKSFALLLTSLAIIANSYAQNTYPWPASGNIGIGIVSPGLRTHILGDTGFPASSGSNQVGILRLQGAGSNGVIDFSVNGGDGGSLQVTNQTDLTQIYPLLLNPNGGKIGIGTTTPASLLEVKGIAPILTLNGTDNSQFKGINFATNGSIQANLLANIQSGELKLQSGTSGFGGFITFNLDGSEKVRIQANTGNVGIGTTSPSEKLSVNGRIRAREVIVETANWADYVFVDGYKVQSLAEVELHIITEKHLPGVPSAKEVAEKGVSIGYMQAILLAKIEELTLHQIQQAKQLASQNERIKALEAENAQLKAGSI